MGYSNLVGTGRCGDVPALERLTGLLNDTSLPIDERIPACFALGKLLDDAERYDEAFARYAEANSLMKARQTASGWRLDPQAFRKQVEEMISVFTPEFFAERRGWGDASQLPVFVVGMPRSGTTLVQQIMASHPSVHGAGELSDLLAIARNLGGDDIRGAATGWQRQALGEAANCHLAHLQAMKPTATRIIDKMPSNVHRVGLIALLFPSARVIQCRRDARDTCLSCYFQLFIAGHEFSYDLADCAQEWLATERLMDHWRKISPLRILDVQYEALVEDLEAQSRRLIDFVDLPWDPACLQFHRTQSAVLTSSVWQVRQPIYHRSIGRWKHYEKHLGPLNKTLAAM
jgi:hypothetical protein